MLSNNFKMHYFHFLTTGNQTFLHLCKFAKQATSIFSTQQYFSIVSAGGSKVIAASLDRQFQDSADFADLSAASLDSTYMFPIFMIIIFVVSFLQHSCKN